MKYRRHLTLAIVGAAVGGCATGSSPASLVATIQIPADAAAGQTIQLVLEVTDSGQPPLTRYQRLVVAVKPRGGHQ